MVGAFPAGPLTPRIEIDGPRVRLGVAWAAGTTLALLLGPVVLGVWLAPFAFAACAQATSTWQGHPARPRRDLALLGAALPLAATAGPVAAGIVAVGLGVVAAAMLRDDRDRLTATLAVAWLCGAGTAAPVIVARELGGVAAGVLVAVVFLYDASVYIVGSGANHRWEGIAAGVASIVSLTVAVAAGLVPPFRGASPWLLGALAAVTAPMGPIVATAMLGPRRRPIPAVRRIDSMLLTAPVWGAVATWLTG